VRALTSIDSLKGILCALLLAGCSSDNGGGGFLSGGVVGDVPKNAKERGGGANDGDSLLQGQSIRQTLLGEGIEENRLPVNKYLWRASLDMVSFLPLASVDTFSGVIATDWGAAPGATNERVRATVFVKDKELTATALDVSVFRETLSPGGTWQTAAVSPQTAEQLEDAILTKARQLRIEDIDG
jgi:hypothetical protein